MSLSKEYCEHVRALSAEYDVGIVHCGQIIRPSCEVSIHSINIPAFIKLVKNIKLVSGRWVIHKCLTCEDHYGPGYCHAEIIPLEHIPDYIDSESIVELVGD